MYPFGDLDLFAGVPPSLIHHQKYALVLARSHHACELIESHREQLHVDRGQDQPVHLSALGPDEAIEIGPFVASLEASNGSLSHRRPHPPYHRLETQATLILGPELHLLGLRMSFLELLQPHRETFLKASRSSESAPWAFEGLGT